MKTSPSQFEMLVTFMEENGDLSKLTNSVRGTRRITSIRKWENLTGLLNSDGAGATKTTEKWKKAWSDFKNNTKKKAARLHREAIGTGGGPAIFAKLSDLEQRVLNVMGLQVATGLAVEEAGLSQEVHIQPSLNSDNEQGIINLHEFEEYSQNVNPDETNALSPQSPTPPSLLRAISSPPHMFVELEVESSQPISHEPGPSRLSIAPAQTPPEARPTTASHRFVESQVEESGLLSPTRPSTQVRVGNGLAASAQTTPRRARRTRGSPRRRTARPAHTEQAAQHFLQADSYWRNFKEQQHNDSIRITELEIQTQRDWQSIGGRLVNVFEKLADKYCKD